MVDNEPYVGILRCSKNPVDAWDKTLLQRAISTVWPVPKDWPRGTDQVLKEERGKKEALSFSVVYQK